MPGRTSCSILAAALLLGCADEGRTPAEPQYLTAPLFSHNTQHETGNFVTHATGSQEVPANDSRAQGQAVFQLSADGTELSYRLIVANIQNVTQAHIHLAPAGANGPVVVWLYPAAPPAQLIPGRFQGVLGEGVITAANFVGQLAGADMAALIGHLLAGNAYVNVHTTQFPPGEVRGQIH
jgi:hypothetical protein